MTRNLMKLILASGVLTACEQATDHTVPVADLVLTGGKIQTMDAERNWAEALCISDTEITFVGSNDDAKACIGDTTNVVQLSGRLVIPGLIDSHMHGIGGAISDVGVNLSIADTPEKLAAALQEIKRLNPGNGVIYGRGWQNFLFDKQGPRKEMLDDVFGPDRAVILGSVDGHSSWWSSGALKAGGLDKSVKDPNPGVVFWERDAETGELLGAAREGAGREAQSKLVTRTPEDYRKAYLAWLPRASAAGLTGYFDAGMGAPGREDAYQLLNSLDAEGKLPLRVFSSVPAYSTGTENTAQTVLDARAKFNSAHHKVFSIKAFADGVPEAHTAYMLEDYKDQPGNRGEPMSTPERLEQVIVDAEKLGVPVHVHAIGDAAVRLTLDKFEVARETDVGETKRARHTIGHMDYVNANDVPRFKVLDVVPQTSIQWATVDPSYDTFVKYVGADIHDGAYPIRDILDTGAKQTFGTDWPAAAYLSTFKPLIQIETAVTRRLSGVTEGPERGTSQGISVMEAIEAMTINVAYQLHEEDTLGSLEVGKKADLLVLGANLFEIPPHTIHKTPVNITVMDGKIVHSEE